MDAVEKTSASAPVNCQRNLLKRRSISLNTAVPFSQAELERCSRISLVKRQVSTDECGHFNEEFHETSSGSSVSTIVLSKLRSFGRQIHRHMIETVNLTNDVSRGIPRSAVGDLYFHGVSPPEVTNWKPASRQYRSGKLSLDLEDAWKCMRVLEMSHDLNNSAQSSSVSKLLESSLFRDSQAEAMSIKSKVPTERRLSTSAPHLEVLEQHQKDKQKKQAAVSMEDAKKIISRSVRPREVNYDDQGQTWEIYGADQDPNALGQAIESHLEKMIQRKQREQRCFSLGNEILQRNTCSTKSSSRASHTGEQIIQAARRRFRRRAVSSATSNSTHTANEDSPDQEIRGRRSRLISYINRILRRSSTSALPTHRHKLLHQDSIMESKETESSLEKTIISAT
ncbi:G protein-regulated inducer of neurite outgrowth 3 [Taenia crassiceps]|uniref:G protein-regulated inducer of neurite outgrowth 3 n=1 Tax=Taenia crassiceps TaxID=6207 RepID=A0ABR4Q939_9CEST